MTFEMILSPERIAAMTSTGYWGAGCFSECTLLDHFDIPVSTMPDKIAIVGIGASTGRCTSLSYRQLDRLSRRAAAGLAALGVQRGEVVSIILPNWLEFVVLHLACLRCGAVTNPLSPILRHRELSFMLKLTESKVVVVPNVFGGIDYPRMIEELQPELPDLQHLLVVGGKGNSSFEDILLNRRWEDDEAEIERLFASRRLLANDMAQIIFTPGTKGEPKGVMHTSNTLLSSIAPYVGRLGLTRGDVVLMALPLAHQTGFIYGMMLAISLGAKLVLQDVWSAETASRLIHDEGASFTVASASILSDIIDAAISRLSDFRSLRMILASGAPIPRLLVQRATEQLGIKVMSSWGTTESGAVTVPGPDDLKDKIFETDGRALAGMEVRVVDEAGRDRPPPAEGRLQVRGAGNFVGYLKRPQYYEVDADGWLATGDLAKIDEDGYISICGCTKDIIIHGDEKIPVAES